MTLLRILFLLSGGYLLMGLICGFAMHHMLVLVEAERGIHKHSNTFSLRFVLGNAHRMPVAMFFIVLHWASTGQGWRQTLDKAYELMLARRQGESCGNNPGGAQ